MDHDVGDVWGKGGRSFGASIDKDRRLFATDVARTATLLARAEESFTRGSRSKAAEATPPFLKAERVRARRGRVAGAVFLGRVATQEVPRARCPFRHGQGGVC